MRGHLAVLLLALTALAGCSDGGDGGDALRLADGSTLELDGEGTSATLGAIAGVVVDEAVRPIPGAVLATADGRNATSDANGVFRLGHLEPGFYALTAQATGFFSVQTSVDVVADETATLKVQLQRDVRPLPYLQTYPYTGYMQVWATIAQFAVEIVADEVLNDTTMCDCSYVFTPDANATDIVLEAFWEPAAPDPFGMAEYYWEIGGLEGSEWYETGYCTSPCRVDVPLGGFVQGEPVLVRFTGPDLWAAVQQQVDLYTTVFYNGPAPEAWSIGATPP